MWKKKKDKKNEVNPIEAARTKIADSFFDNFDKKLNKKLKREKKMKQIDQKKKYIFSKYWDLAKKVKMSSIELRSTVSSKSSLKFLNKLNSISGKPNLVDNCLRDDSQRPRNSKSD